MATTLSNGRLIAQQQALSGGQPSHTRARRTSHTEDPTLSRLVLRHPLERGPETP